MQIVIIILLILAMLLVIFTLQNSIGVTINLFFWEITDAPLVLILLVCILAGTILSSIYYLPKIWKLKGERNSLRKEKERLLNENPVQPKLIDKPENPEGEELKEDEDNSFFSE